jgi:hypothetical protein
MAKATTKLTAQDPPWKGRRPVLAVPPAGATGNTSIQNVSGLPQGPAGASAPG